MSAHWDDDTDDDEPLDEWEEVELDDGTTTELPKIDREDFLDEVWVHAEALGASTSFGPMVSERREYICSSGNVYFVRRVDDWGPSNTIVGRFDTDEEGVAAAVDASYGFVPARSGPPVCAWSDEGWDGEIDGWETWEPDDEDDEDGDDEGFVSRCAHPFSDSSHSPLFSMEQRRANYEALWDVTITHRGIQIAGPEAVDELPAPRIWHAIPCTEDEYDHLCRVLHTLDEATVESNGVPMPAALTDRMASTAAARVGKAFGAETIWRLDRSSIQAIHTDEPTVIAEGVRVR